MKTATVHAPHAVERALPTDCRHRRDLQLLKAGDTAAAQEMKIVLEEKQRAERKLREEGQKQLAAAGNVPVHARGTSSTSSQQYTVK